MRIKDWHRRSYWFWLMPLVWTSFASGQQPTPVREVDAVCASCHQKIFRDYVTTPMAIASGMATDNLKPGTLTHARSAMEYSIAGHGKQGDFAYRSLDARHPGGSYPLSYFLGSGHLGTTYLYSVGGFLFESPIAWYGPSQSYDMKPGMAEIDRMPPLLPMQSGCMRCHMSSVQSSDPGTINRYSSLPFLHGGITCEACHGDSRDHVRSNGKAAIVNPARLNADCRDSICISCHLEGDVTIERAGHSVLNYAPGQSISTYLAFYVRAGANLTDRAVSEVEQLSQSTCKRMSGDRMSCTSCHDPHSRPDSGHRASFFRTKCLACHNQPNFAGAHHPENTDCTSCHMPQTSARNVLHVAWTDHRIRRLPEKPMPAPDQNASGELVPIFSPGASKRDLALANYQALLEGDGSRQAAAWEQLNALRNDITNDKQALDALGNMSAERGDLAGAEHAFRRVLELDPVDLTALSNLGTLLAKQGKLAESLTVLEKAFNNNQDIPGLAKNLATVQCMAGDGAAARNTITASLAYCPDCDDLQRLLAGFDHCSATGRK